MKKLSNILFYSYGAPGEAAAPALTRVAALAKKSDAVLTVAGLLEEIPRDLWMLVPPIGAGPVAELAAAELLERLEQLVEPYRRRGVDIDTEVLLGDPCRELVRAVERRRHELLVVVPGEGAAERRTLVRLLKTAPCPVWIARPGVTATGGSILAAVEPERGDDVKRLLSRKVVEIAAALARLEAARLEILCLREAAPDKLPALRSGEPAHASAAACWPDLLGALELLPPPDRLHVGHGRLGSVLKDLVRHRPIDVAVLGVTARTRARGWFSASRLETLLDELPCSLLAVRQQMTESQAKQEAA